MFLLSHYATKIPPHVLVGNCWCRLKKNAIKCTKGPTALFWPKSHTSISAFFCCPDITPVIEIRGLYSRLFSSFALRSRDLNEDGVLSWPLALCLTTFYSLFCFNLPLKDYSISFQMFQLNITHKTVSSNNTQHATLFLMYQFLTEKK